MNRRIDNQSEKFLNLRDKLNGKYYEVFESIQLYIESYLSISGNTKGDILNDILCMFLDAQQRGEPLEKVIGQDYKSFCDNIINESKFKDNKLVIILQNLYPFMLCAAILSITKSIDVIENFADKTTSSLNMPIKVELLFFSIFMLFICYIFVVIMRRKSFSEYKYIYLFLLMPLALVPIIPLYVFKPYMNIVLFSIPFYIPIILTWSLFIGTTIFLKKHKKNHKGTVSN